MTPILNPNTLEFFSLSTEQTRRVGMRLGALLQTSDLVCLAGDLGSGKTTLTQGIAAGWGSLDQVSSPTYMLVNTYRHASGSTLYHLDAYRLSGPAEAEDLDLDTMLAQGPMIIEWADIVREALPADHLWVELRWLDEEQRGMQFSAQGQHYENLLTEFQQSVYGV